MSTYTKVFDKDSYTDDLLPTENNGGDTDLYACYDASGGKGFEDTRNAWASVDFSDLDITAGQVDSAYVYVRYSVDGDPSNSDMHWYRRTGDAWTELGITWNNQPVADGSKSGEMTLAPEIGVAWEKWDITAQIVAAIAAGKLWDASLKNDNQNSTTFAGLIFYSREYGGYEPFIVINYSPPAGGSILKISGEPWAHVLKVSGIAEASISKVSGVAAN